MPLYSTVIFKCELHWFLFLPRQHYQGEVDVFEVLYHEFADESSRNFPAGNFKNGGYAESGIRNGLQIIVAGVRFVGEVIGHVLFNELRRHTGGDEVGMYIGDEQMAAGGKGLVKLSDSIPQIGHVTEGQGAYDQVKRG